jgi:hypothetical protein
MVVCTKESGPKIIDTAVGRSFTPLETYMKVYGDVIKNAGKVTRYSVLERTILVISRTMNGTVKEF